MKYAKAKALDRKLEEMDKQAKQELKEPPCEVSTAGQTEEL